MNYIFVHLLDIKMFKSLIDARYKHEEYYNTYHCITIAYSI